MLFRQCGINRKRLTYFGSWCQTFGNRQNTGWWKRPRGSGTHSCHSDLSNVHVCVIEPILKGFSTQPALFGVQHSGSRDVQKSDETGPAPDWSRSWKLMDARIKAEMNVWHRGELDLDCLSLRVSTLSSSCNISALINYTAITSSPLMVYLFCEIMTALRAWFKSPIHKSLFIVALDGSL